MRYILKWFALPVGIVEHLLLKTYYTVQYAWVYRAVWLIMFKYDLLLLYLGSVLAYKREDIDYALKLIREAGHETRQMIKIKHMYGRMLSTQEVDKLRYVLRVIYTHQIRCEFAMGWIEDAALTAIVACENLGLDYIPGMPRLDLKTAKILSACMEAGRQAGPNIEVQMKFTNTEPPKKPKPSWTPKPLPGKNATILPFRKPT